MFRINFSEVRPGRAFARKGKLGKVKNYSAAGRYYVTLVTIFSFIIF